MKRIVLFQIFIVFLLSGHALAYELNIAGNIPIPDKITAVAESPDLGMSAVVSETGKSLSLINIDTNQVIKRISLDVAPSSVAIDTTRNRAIVSSVTGSVVIIDMNSANTVNSISVPCRIHSIAIHDGLNLALLATDTGIIELDLLTENVVTNISLPNPVTGIRIFGDDIVAISASGNNGFLIYRINILSGTIEKQLAVNSDAIGIDACKEKGFIFTLRSNGVILVYDPDLNLLNTITFCDSALSCKMLSFSFNPLINAFVIVDALANKIIVMGIDGTLISASTSNFAGLSHVVIDATRNVAEIVYAQGLLTVTLENPVPRIDYLIPQTAKSGSEGFSLSVEGDKFVRGSQAQFNQKNATTYFRNTGKLLVDLNTEDLLLPGNIPVSVTNPRPGGGLSNSIMFNVYSLSPMIDAILPEFVAVNTSFSLRVSGRNLFNGSIIKFNGMNSKTRFISSILLEADIDRQSILQTGTYAVTIVNPQPEALTSNPGYLSVVERGDPRLQSSNNSNPLQGFGSLKGKIVNTNLKPLEGITIKIKNLRAVTDAQGNFLLQNVPAGKNVLLMDGSTAKENNGHYPTIPITVNIQAGIVNDMPFQPYLHQQKSRNFKHINPAEDTVLTDPEVPGFEMRIPKGVKIIGWDGQPNLKVSVRTVPTDRLPVKPLPQNSFARTVYMFYFNKVGGGTPDQPIPVRAVNDLGLLPGQKATLWYYDESPNEGEAPNDWAIAGTGTVTPDGRYIVSDPGVGVPKFCCGATAYGGSSAGNTPTGPADGGDGDGGDGGSDGPDNIDGDPVNLATGYFIHSKVDYSVPGLIPFSIKRFYRSGDTGAGAFGKGTHFGYDWWLGVYTDMLLLLKPGNYQYRFYKQADGTYANTTDPVYKGAVFYQNADNTYTLRRKNGWTYKFGTSRLLDEIKDPNGNTITFLKYGGNITTIILPDGRTINISYVIGVRDNITSITGPFGTVTYSYYSNGANGQLRSVQYPDGSSISYTYDASGRMSSITKNGNLVVSSSYDSNDRVIGQTLASGGTYSFAYTVAGGYVTQTAMTAPNGAVKAWRFNNYQYITDVTNPDGTTTYQRDPGTNQILSVTDPLLRRKTYTYDAKGRVTAVTDNGGNVTSYEYEDVYNRVTKITNALGNVRTMIYDANGNLASFTDSLGKSARISYNTMGKPLSITDALGNVTTFIYDASGNLTSVTDPLGSSASLTYNSLQQPIITTDAKGKSTSYSYDIMGRILSVTDPLGNVTNNSYTLDGKLSVVRDAKNQDIKYEYDNRNRVARMIDHLNTAETYSYDTSNNLVTVTDRKGQTTTYTYDLMNRVTRADYADGSYTTYSYDAAGRLISITDSVSGTISYTYTDAGCGGTCSGVAANRVASETTPLRSVNYTYDVIGRRTSMIVAGQPAVNYVYDADNRLTGIVTIISGTTNTFSLDYDDIGRRRSVSLSNGIATNYTYDNASRLLNLQYVDSASNVLESLVYTYDANGNRTTMNRPTVNLPLLGPAFNISNNEANQVLTFNDKTIAYDANGNMTSITDTCGTTIFTWDARNRLSGINGFTSSCAPLSASFQYDAIGRRIGKTVNGTTTQYLYDGLDIIQDIQGGLMTNYIRTLNIDEPLTRIKADGTVRHYVRDALGSIIALTDNSGVVKTTYVYDPFGNVTVAGEVDDNPLQYTGRENDETGLYYYRARYYSPELRRFVSQDPIGLRGGINLYAYVGNRPINFSDPFGLKLVIIPTNNRIPVVVNTETGVVTNGYPEINDPTSLDRLSTVTELIENGLHGIMAVMEFITEHTLILIIPVEDASACP